MTTTFDPPSQIKLFDAHFKNTAGAHASRYLRGVRSHVLL